ncbi:MAG: UDP-N-acetylmuramoylalanine-D-glutamate ligase [candidate division TM6 bacterium GW2011_GWE2_41_16]|nr:MAG: UDP-N-acetylmuramoylalanine-D-glutamate ligase [candidate division TM6 bacterium GW2011_GWE2_41_16]
MSTPNMNIFEQPHIRIGVWGLGVTGKSIITYIKKKYPHVTLVACAKQCDEITQKLLLDLNIPFFLQEQLNQFAHEVDYLIPSPGIDVHAFPEVLAQCVQELDLFAQIWRGKTIAVTGSIGKTSTVHLLHRLIESTGKKVFLGGNVGIPLFDLLAEHNTPDTYAILELSSFQLELSSQLKPDVAVITNIFPNHLDRHKTLDAYTAAKYKLFEHLPAHAQALVPFELVEYFRSRDFAQRPLNVFFSQKPTPTELAVLNYKEHEYNQSHKLAGEHDREHACGHTCVLFIEQKNTRICELVDGSSIKIGDYDPSISFPQTWLIGLSVCSLLGLKPQAIDTTHMIPAHRGELVETINEVAYYNDSKSTVMQATIASTEKLLLKHPRVILLLGGMSKGVDRTPFIKTLNNKPVFIICFGKEASALASICKSCSIPHTTADTLQQACIFAYKEAQPHEAVLLSPGGTSFDLFANYQERGHTFVTLIKTIAKQ